MKELGKYHGFNIRPLYYEAGVPHLKEGYTTDILLWNVITYYYHEYIDILDQMKEKFKKEPIIGSFVINTINFVTNDMASFCNEHKVPDPRPHKNGEMIPLPIDEYPIWFNNLEDFISDLTWSDKDRKIMMNDVLPKLLNSFEIYSDVIKDIDFSVKDSSEVETMVDEILELFPDKVKEYRSGKKGIANMFFGQLMKKTKGKIDAKEARKILEEKLAA